MPQNFSSKTIGRLSLYRLFVNEQRDKGATHVFSHELAAVVSGTAAQVRRDLMTIGATGSPAKGYEIAHLRERIENMLDPGKCRTCVLVGVGNLGRALLSYFVGRDSQFNIAAAFDVDPDRIGRVIHGCRSYHVDELDDFVAREGIKLGLLTCPADAVQGAADALVRSGVLSIVNFAPKRIWVPEGIYVESIGLTMRLERAAFFAGERMRGEVK